MANDGLICWSCGKPTGLLGRITRSDNCPECGSDLRCCRGCRHFDPTRRFQCKEPVESNVVNKEKNNFCDWFQARDVVKRTGGATNPTADKDDRKKKFDDLFKE